MLAVALASLLSVAAAEPPAAGKPLVDHFASFDAAKWVVSNGWANGPWSLNDWQASQVKMGRPGLLVSLNKSATYSGGYSSGEIQSRRSYRYGYFEISLQAARGDGLVNGFFTYTGPPRGHPWNEIDVEILGKDPRAVLITYHTDAGSWTKTVPLGFDASEQQHIYAFDWQPNYVRWYVDGVLIHEETGTGLAKLNISQQMMFQLWAANASPSWAGVFKWPGSPPVARVGCMAASTERPAAPLCRTSPRESAGTSGN